MTETAVSYQQSVFSGQFEVSTTFRLSEVSTTFRLSAEKDLKKSF